MTLRTGVAIGILVLVSGLFAAAPAPMPEAPDSVQDFVWLAESRPVLVRLHIQIDGRPLAAAWDDFVNHVFDYLDVDHDGVLNQAEAARLPSAEAFFRVDFLNDVKPVPLAELDTQPADGQVSREELKAYFRKAGGPVRVQYGESAVDFRGEIPEPARLAALTGPLNEALFDKLDRDRDGQLSRNELAAAPVILGELDANEDEMIEVPELLPQMLRQLREISQRERTPGPRKEEQLAFLAMMPGSSLSLGRQLETRYAVRNDKVADRKRTRSSLGFDPRTFAQLDADGDGALDSEELGRFARRSPDLSLRIELNTQSSQTLGAVVGDEHSLTARWQKRNPIFGTLDLGLDRLDLRMQPGTELSPFIVGILREQYRAQFSRADKDGDGFVDWQEAQKAGNFQKAFLILDRDGDNRISEVESLAFLDWMTEARQRARASHCTLVLSDHGQSLFDLMDVDRDGRLSVRELRQVAALLPTLDRDGNGRLQPKDLPHGYQAVLRPGRDDVPTGFLGFNRARSEPADDGPARLLWFRKMDRNRDGDVSRKEFIGSEKDFQRLDLDGDGLISLEEAGRGSTENKP